MSTEAASLARLDAARQLIGRGEVPAAREILRTLSADEDAVTQSCAEVVIDLAKRAAEFPTLLEAAVIGWDPLESAVSEAVAFTSDALLHAVLSHAVACDADLERVLTHLRRCMLLRLDAETLTFAFTCALARQCFNVEHSYFVAEDEARPLRELEARLGSMLQFADAGSPEAERLLALAALYKPLHRLPDWERMLRWPPRSLSRDFRPLWQEQVAQHREEQDIAAGIETLSPIRNEVSVAVRSQYEANPYPRWKTLLRPEARPLAGSILVAGCGTGKHPIHTALTFPRCEVLAVDLSRASLAYAVRMARRFGAKNVSFLQADILELGALQRRFELIEAIGVLHHLGDPLAGWRTLAGLLGENGRMRIALYSDIARVPLEATRDFIRRHGFPATADGIRRCRRAILDLPDDEPARSVMASDDFYSRSGFRDLVMHAQEHRFTLPQIDRCLHELGLRFQGFQCSPELSAGFQAAFPEPAALTDLALWDRYERVHPDSFRGMYVFHCGRGP